MKQLIILIMLSITVLLFSQEKITGNEPTIVIDSDKAVWDSLTPEQQFLSFKTSHNAYVKYRELYQRARDREDKLVIDLTKRWYPRYAIGLGVLSGIDNTLDIDIYTVLKFKKYFLEGRTFIDIEGGIKIYKNIGGCIYLGLGFCL